MNRISDRLRVISEFVPNDCRGLIDIGCDHGLLDIYLCERNNISKIIASDINKNALENARNNVEKFNLTDKIDLRLGNGLEVLSDYDDIDTVVIAGMGTNTILDIMMKSKNVFNCVIVQSNTKLFELRECMQNLGYVISDEEVVIEKGKYYVIIKFVPGVSNYSYKELYFGPILLKKNNINFLKYKDMQLKKLKVILKSYPTDKIEELEKLNREIELYK